mmetsp:Transcript_69149/g.193259  ORF Transcript_69149/g.193259 Transcript_69149/m.193259 type:complete len:219 (-) Transcript_69149:903-1559(-)
MELDGARLRAASAHRREDEIVGPFRGEARRVALPKFVHVQHRLDQPIPHLPHILRPAAEVLARVQVAEAVRLLPEGHLAALARILVAFEHPKKVGVRFTHVRWDVEVAVDPELALNLNEREVRVVEGVVERYDLTRIELLNLLVVVRRVQADAPSRRLERAINLTVLILRIFVDLDGRVADRLLRPHGHPQVHRRVRRELLALTVDLVVRRQREPAQC